MNLMIQKMMAAALCICAAPAMLYSQKLSAAETQPAGKFSVEPDYLLGDVNNDNVVDAADAARLLEAIAVSGVEQSTLIGGSEEADARFRTYGDANGDGRVDVSDAAEILIYAARKGVGAETHPLGFAYYYADENGDLLTGRIDDTASGESFYAGENYKLLTSEWVHEDGNVYYLNTEGVMLKQTWAVSEAGTVCWMGEDGALVLNDWADTGEGLCYLGEDGIPADGLQIVDGNGYYFVNNLLRTGWLMVGDMTCYAGENGVLYQGICAIDGNTYFFGSDYAMQTGWVQQNGESYYFDENGVMLTGWQEIGGQTYYLSGDGCRQSGLVTLDDGTYYLDENGVLLTGFQSVAGATRYFYPESGHMATGFVYLSAEAAYYFGEDGVMATGWQEIGGDRYYFSTDGIMTTGYATVDGVLYEFDSDGVCLGAYEGEITDVDIMLNTAVLSEQKRSITVYDQQKGSGKELVDFTFKLSDNDIAIIEQFAAEHFPENATLAEKLYITHQWIHYNVDYAYAGEKWNEIVSLSYVDAVFNHQKGQCVQYNGAMASVLAYYGFDVYMVKGYTSPGTQHFWTEVELNGHTYMVECGNSGKNGDWWQYFFDQMD